MSNGYPQVVCMIVYIVYSGDMNKYPDGKIKEDDEGSLEIKLFIKDGRLIIDFGKETAWIGFDKKSLLSLIELLKVKSESL